MPRPYLTIDLAKIEHNARTITTLCARHGIATTGVTKGTCGHPEVARARLVVSNPDLKDTMTLLCEAAAADDLRSALETSMRDVTKLRGEVEFVAAGSLPNDGKVIDDIRSYV